MDIGIFQVEPGGVSALYGAVDQRFIGIVEQRYILSPFLLCAKAVRENVGIEGGRGGQGQTSPLFGSMATMTPRFVDELSSCFFGGQL